MRWIIAMLAVVGLSYCTVIESNRAGTPFLTSGGFAKRTYYQGSYSLPRKYVSYKILANNRHFASADHFAVTEAPTASVLVPDPSAGFRFDVNYAPSRFSRDKIKFEMADQMLSTITISTDDQTDDALVNFAQAAAQIARLSAGLSTKPEGNFTFDAPGSSSGGDKIDKVVAQISFDPTDYASVTRAKKRLGRMMNLRIQPEPRPVIQNAGCNHSVCYRPLTTVLISFEEPHSGNTTDFIVQVPDPHQVSGIDLERSAFVDRETTLTFSSGTLQKIDMAKPSEIAQGALLPVRVIDAVFTGTGNAIKGLLGLRQNELDGSIELLNAQAKYLDALVAYRKTVESTQAAGVNTAAIGQRAQQTGPASFGTPGGQTGGEAREDGAGEAKKDEGPATFGSAAAPGGGSGDPDTAVKENFTMTCTPNAGCEFKAAKDG